MIVSWLNRVGTVSLRGLVAFGKFWYGFIIGDDWTVAAAVAAALVVTWLLHTAGVAAWWLPPLVAGGSDRSQPSPHQRVNVRQPAPRPVVARLAVREVSPRTLDPSPADVTPRSVRIIQIFRADRGVTCSLAKPRRDAC